MDKLTLDFAPSSRIDLAREADFVLGALRVRPSRCEIEADGERRVLQRRVMQVLVALAHSTSEVVSQKELILRCWDGLMVGDDAIGRCIGQLRRFSESRPQPPFDIETIPGVGYRLQAAPDAGTAAIEPARRRFRKAIPMLATLGVVVMVAAAVALWAFGGARQARPPTVAVEPLQVLGGGPGAGTLAKLLADDISGTLNEAGVQTPPPGPVFPLIKADRTDLLFGGTVDQDGQVSRVRLYLEDRQARATLWSEEFEGRADDARGLADHAAALATETIFYAIETTQQPGLRLTPHTRALFLRSMQFVASSEPLHAGEVRRDLEEALRASPDFVDARATYALVLQGESLGRQGPERRRLMDLAASEANTAIHQDPRSAGGAFDAQFMLQAMQNPTDFAAAEAPLLAGLRAAPDLPFLQMRECELLDQVGRFRAALPFCQRAIALRPMAAPIGWSYAVALNTAGESPWADRQMESTARLYPGQESTRMARFMMAALGPSPQKALDLLRDPATVPHLIPPDGVPALELFLRARISNAPADTRVAVAALSDAVSNSKLDLGVAVVALARLNAREEALKLLAEAPSRRDGWGRWGRWGIQFLVDPTVTPLRTDPRYWAAARQVGLVRYWTQTAWPDFCDQPSPRIDCQALAAASRRG